MDDGRVADTVRLPGTSTTIYAENGCGERSAHQLHDSRQLPGTVSMIRCAFPAYFEEADRLSPNQDWVSGQAWSPTSEEVKKYTFKVLDWFWIDVSRSSKPAAGEYSRIDLGRR